MRTATIGAIRVRSNNNNDLVCAFAKKLLWLDQEGFYSDLIQKALVAYKENSGTDNLTKRLIKALNSFAPKYCSFCKNPNLDNAWGYWVSNDFLNDFDGLMVYELSERPDYYTGEIIHMVTPTNIALYSCKDGELTLIWEI